MSTQRVGDEQAPELRPIPAVIARPVVATNLSGQTNSGGLVKIAFDRPLRLDAGDRVYLPWSPDEQSSVVVTDAQGEEKEVRRYQDGAYRFIVDDGDA